MGKMGTVIPARATQSVYTVGEFWVQWATLSQNDGGKTTQKDLSRLHENTHTLHTHTLASLS